ncbi:ABC transporter permease subunit [Streptomyces sannanensis]|uniref:ABC transporter permease subunit n=1 Tax=Streptomyces sannanensis TaxID=285536 RepID=A0ABP6SJT7_9ACTN
MSAVQTAARGDSLPRSSGGTTSHGAARRWRLPRSARWLGVLPLLVFAVVVFGLSAGTMVFGAFTTPETMPGGARFTGANFIASLHGPHLAALINSVELSAVSALIAAVVGLPIAHAVVTSRFRALREAALAGAGVLANVGGVPLAFAFVATLGNAGVLTTHFALRSHGWNLYSFWGLTLAYLYFLIPLMVLTLAPALDGLRRQWREAARNNGASAFRYWTHVALPILMPSLLGGFVLLFGSAFSAYATAAAMVGSSVPLVTMQIADALSGDVLVGEGNVALALGVDMVLVAGLVMAVQLPLQRRSARWLA